MSEVVILAEELGKKYTIGHQTKRESYTALRDVIARRAQVFLRKAGDMIHGRPIIEGDDLEEVWALRDVSFEVKRGEVVGIIGRNGAGKSTLLKILSRITEPTTGRVHIHGRVASLLEVGTGFHPELTGRENICLNGAILGMSREEIKRKFDEIVAFAEIDKFLDTPVKRYSSGMYVRLAFAVAAHLESDILIVDEVLAVGDGAFQKKCLGKMNNVAKGEGRTVLFVSHNMAASQSLCTEAIYLRSGELVAKGEFYSQLMQYSRDVVDHRVTGLKSRRRLSDTVAVEAMDFGPNPICSGLGLDFSIEFSSTLPTNLKELCLLFYSGIGVRVAIVDLRSNRLDYAFGGDRPLTIKGGIRRLNLIEGDYSVGIYIHNEELKGDFYDLYPLCVLKTDRSSDMLPYAPLNRGFVELDYQFSIG